MGYISEKGLFIGDVSGNAKPIVFNEYFKDDVSKKKYSLAGMLT